MIYWRCTGTIDEVERVIKHLLICQSLLKVTRFENQLTGWKIHNNLYLVNTCN